jgi:hypothetical protein
MTSLRGGLVPGGAALASGPGTSRPAGRGMPIGSAGLTFVVGGPIAPGDELAQRQNIDMTTSQNLTIISYIEWLTAKDNSDSG